MLREGEGGQGVLEERSRTGKGNERKGSCSMGAKREKEETHIGRFHEAVSEPSGKMIPMARSIEVFTVVPKLKEE